MIAKFRRFLKTTMDNDQFGSPLGNLSKNINTFYSELYRARASFLKTLCPVMSTNNTYSMLSSNVDEMRFIIGVLTGNYKVLLPRVCK